MNLLFANDRRGEYPQSWYAATANTIPPFDTLRGEVRADVCIVGAGYTGLSAALHLAERGFDVVLLEAHRVGFGASGRNGGQLGSGQRTLNTRSTVS
jgi:gamma-glutamylputrescine oxidase